MHSFPMIAVSSWSFTNSKKLIAELEDLKIPFKLAYCPNLDGENLTNFLSEGGANIAIVGREKIDEKLLKKCPKLKFIAKYGVGLDNLDLQALEQCNVEFGFTPGVNKRSVSELTLGLILMHLHNINASIWKLKQGVWDKNGGKNLSHKTVGIVGFGNVGQDLAHLLSRFGCKVLACDILDKSEEAYRLNTTMVSYQKLLEESDIVTFHVPLTSLTFHMLGEDKLKFLKKHTLVVNTSRGPVVNLQPICSAVQEGKIGGFACDVFEKEPFSFVEHQIYPHPHLYFTPHIGGSSEEAMLAMGQSALAHVKRFLAKIG